MKTFKIIKYERNEYAKKIRKDYESRKIKERRSNLRQITIGNEICNTITSLQKDNYILEISEE